MPKTTRRLLDKLRALEALRNAQRPPPRRLLSRFASGLAEFLRDYRRGFVPGLIDELSSFMLQLGLAFWVGIVVAAMLQSPPVFPVAVACLAMLVLRLWVRNAKKKRDRRYRL